MSYIVEQKIKGRIYLYEVVSYWDKDKKQPRQKRKYIGPKNPVKNLVKPIDTSNLSVQKYGSVFLLNALSDKIGLKNVLAQTFPDTYKDILNLAYYHITDNQPDYLFEYWYQQHFLPHSRKLNSSKISELYTQIGTAHPQRIAFIKQWIAHLNPIKTVFYDITSFSGYSHNNDFIEWGYNRDNDHLPQINLGLVYCNQSALPIYYRTHPGSLADVSTLKTIVEYLKGFGLEHMLMVLDRGFFSKSNILSLANDIADVAFIQPLPFRLKKVREMARLYARDLPDYSNAFLHNNSLLYHFRSRISFDERTFQAHIFLNEKVRQEEKERFLFKLLQIEHQHKDKTFKTFKDFIAYKEAEIPEQYHPYFKWRRYDGKMEKNRPKINRYLAKSGIFIIANNSGLTKEEIIDYYRSKDSIEKVFNGLKNELSSDRLRTHSHEATEGKLFVKFITAILYSSVSRVMAQKGLFKSYTLRELMLELDKITRTKLEEKIIFSELTKKQKKIFQAFDVKWNDKT